MKKILIASVLILSLVSLVFAQVGPADGTGPEHDAIVAAGGQEGNPTAGEGIGVRVMAGNYIGEQGQHMMIQMQNEMCKLEVDGVIADCPFNMTQEMVQNRTRLSVALSNGRNAEVKIMPDVASETALQRLRLKDCGEECSIELKEFGVGENVRAAYEIQTKRDSKIFGLFGARMNVQAQVDAETGEIIQTKKPWWAFLATEPEEE